VKKTSLLLGCALFILSLFNITLGQTISYGTAGSTYTQDFNTLPNTGTFTYSGGGPFDLNSTPVNASGLTGWYGCKYSGTASNMLFTVGTGSATAGSVYSFGSTSSVDRGLGCLASGGNIEEIGALFTNNTGITLNKITITFTGEQWRLGSGAIDKLTFQYKIGASTINDAGYVSNSNLDFTAPNTAAGDSATNGNSSGDRSSVTYTITGLTWNNGEILGIRWQDANDAGNDDGLAIDDFTFSSSPQSSATFSVIGTLTSFSQTLAAPTGEQTYNISGTGLTTNVTVVPPAGFEISKTTGSGFVTSSGSLIYSAADVITGRTIYVRMNSGTPGLSSGNITHTSAGSEFTPANQPVSGTYTPKCILSLTSLIEGFYDGSIMVPDTVTIELRNASTLALVDQSKGLLNSSGSGSFSFSSASNNTNYYIIVKHRNAVETWSQSAQSFTSYALNYNFTTASTQAYGSNLVSKNGKFCIYSGDVNQDGVIDSGDLGITDNDNTNYVSGYTNTDINGDGLVDSGDLGIADNNNSGYVSKISPISLISFSATGSLTTFTQNSSSASTEQTYNISGSNLTANVTLVPPAGFEISKTTGSGFVTSTGNLVYTAAEVMAGQTIYVRLHAGSSGSYSGNITHTSANSEFSQVTKSVSGSYTATPVFTVTGSLSTFSQTSATPSAEQTYSISGTNLTGNVTLVSPAGFEISKTTSTGFVTSSGSLVYTAAEVMAGKTIFVRLNAASPGNYSGSITHTSANAEFTQAAKSVSGSYVVVSSNVNLIMGNPTSAVTSVDSIHNYLLDKPQFCASYDRDRRIANWTSWQLNSAWLVDNSTRNDPYRVDPTLPAGWPQVGSAYNYSTYGFDRGHLCPSADRVNTQTDNDALFVMTNLIPQNPTNNQGVWASLETYERSLVSGGNVVYIYTGGWGTGGTSAQGTFNRIVSGSGIDTVSLTVPAKLWKVMIVIPSGTSTSADVARVDTTTRTIAVIMNNDQGPFGTWQSYRVSVDSVEALTGYNFFSNVPPSIQAVIEAKVDTQ
jgi:endonuclease G, mitochondrial